MGRVRVGRASAGLFGSCGAGVLLCAASLAGLGFLPAAPAGAATTPTETNTSYAIVDAAGGVMTWGGAGYSGDTIGVALTKPIVGAAADPTGGYWLVASDGGIFDFGGAPYEGSTGATRLNKPIVGMAPTPDGGGYWLVASDGGIFNFGDAGYFGSTGATPLNKPIVGMAATPDGKGYWLVASDGGIFTFGDAGYFGSTGATRLNKPIVGMAATGDGKGYWLVASDGGIFTFGDAPYYGSAGGSPLNSPIVGMSATPDGKGYWLVGADGGIFTYGDAGYSGSAQSPLHPPLFPNVFSVPIAPVVAIIPDAPGTSATHHGALRVAFEGDSLALYEAQYTTGTSPPYQVDDGAAPGCGLTNGAPLKPWSNPGAVYTDPEACALWAQQLQWVTSRFHPDVSVLQAGYWESQDRLFGGAFTTMANSAYAAYIQNNLNQAVNILHSDGGAVILETSPYYNDGTPNDLVAMYNQIVHTVASEYPTFVSVLDTYSILDPGGAYATVVNGVVARTTDGVHLTQAGVVDLVVPPLNQLIASVGQAVYNGVS
jgi:hypothetical protein